MRGRNFPYYLVLVLLWPLMGMQCEKENSRKNLNGELAKLPPFTTEGKGKVGCLVNGMAWLPDTCCSSSSTPPRDRFTSNYFQDLGSYQFRATKNLIGDTTTGFTIDIEDFELKPKRYSLVEYKRDTSSGARFRFLDRSNNITKDYVTNNTYNGFFEVVSINPSSQLISGRFGFTAESETNEIIRITHGRFDVWFQYR